MVSLACLLKLFFFTSLNCSKTALAPSSTSTRLTSSPILKSLKGEITMQLKFQLCWTRHIFRMRNYCLPGIILCNELSTGYCDRRAPRKQYKNFLKRFFGACHINHHWWSTLAENCDTWYLTTNPVVSSFENTHRVALKDKRHRRRNQIRPSATATRAYPTRACSWYGWPPIRSLIKNVVKNRLETFVPIYIRKVK